MAKEPEPGATKTRLVPPLTPDVAAQLYECFLLDVLDLVRSLAGVTPFIAVSPVGAEAYFHRVAPDLGRLPQIGESLGDRLDYVLTSCLRAGFDQVAAIGSDVPTLPADHVWAAFDLLDDDDVDVVLGPSEDGGYHLIGWKRSHPRLVRDVQMSTPHVLQDTLRLAEANDVRVVLLPNWYDVDVPADLERVGAELRHSAAGGHHTREFLALQGD